MADFDPRDAAAPILAGEPQLNDQTRANLWDAFHNSKDPEELTRIIEPLAVPDDTRQKLLAAKQAAPPVPQVTAAPTGNPATTAIGAMSSIPSETLDMAESHPNVLKAIMDGLKPPEEKETDTEAKKAPLTPRPDGKPHFPPIPEGHYRVLASDGGIHDIPQANIDIARRIDPLLHVLNA